VTVDFNDPLLAISGFVTLKLGREWPRPLRFAGGFAVRLSPNRVLRHIIGAIKNDEDPDRPSVTLRQQRAYFLNQSLFGSSRYVPLQHCIHTCLPSGARRFEVGENVIRNTNRRLSFMARTQWTTSTYQPLTLMEISCCRPFGSQLRRIVRATQALA
jgi:hypothetical protein